MDLVMDSLSSSWAILEDSAIFLLAGFFLAGLVKVFLPMDLVKRKLGADGFGSVFNAALVGIPLPLCSCSVIPTAVSLRSSGASKGATSAFLISTPESGVDSIAITYALMDPVMTVFRPVAAFATALFAGVMENLIGDKKSGSSPQVDIVCKDDCCADKCESIGDPSGPDEPPAGDPPRGKLVTSLHFAFVELVDDLVGWLLIGILAAGVVEAMLPDDFFTQFAGDGFISMLVMLAAGVPMYICATASTPLAAALMIKGLSPGAALVFLLSGPATNIGTLVIIRKLLGTRSAIIYLSAIAIGSLSAGLALNGLYQALEIDATAALGQAAEVFPHQVELAAALIFSALALRSFASGLIDRSLYSPQGKPA
ncbi:MAG: SO_0444 family Cu/Zn efflux transporter [Nitrospinota bacterium]|nr:SO_0444 family Cu/Zn efflux transporter [Nitrospinota bacterium]